MNKERDKMEMLEHNGYDSRIVAKIESKCQCSSFNDIVDSIWTPVQRTVNPSVWSPFAINLKGIALIED